ncbi:hypothetical protein HanRHA438_Chr01g0018781 [Helianthus annuus]|nr:hypothetical protein HanRHA438_Chr01g0018781 [Helianthus annuus]
MIQFKRSSSRCSRSRRSSSRCSMFEHDIPNLEDPLLQIRLKMIDVEDDVMAVRC